MTRLSASRVRAEAHCRLARLTVPAMARHLAPGGDAAGGAFQTS